MMKTSHSQADGQVSRWNMNINVFLIDIFLSWWRSTTPGWWTSIQMAKWMFQTLSVSDILLLCPYYFSHDLSANTVSIYILLVWLSETDFFSFLLLFLAAPPIIEYFLLSMGFLSQKSFSFPQHCLEFKYICEFSNVCDIAWLYAKGGQLVFYQFTQYTVCRSRIS